MALPVVVPLMLVLPQVAGFAAARWSGRALAWPGVAFATFAVGWYATAWAPHAAETAPRAGRAPCACGQIFVVDIALLLAGLAVHVGGGVLLAWLDRRGRRAFLTDDGRGR